MNSEREERKKGEREREIGGLFGVGEYSTRLLARARAFTHTHTHTSSHVESVRYASVK